jgi:cation/acetate symporter
VSVSDVNGDGVLQLGELHIASDVLVLAAPEIGGMPFAVACLVAAGGLAAALSTADGLLLTIANALSHDLYFKILNRGAPTHRQVVVSKVILLLTALLAAVIALQRPAGILLLVTPVFSIAAATIFPALVMGIFWRRTNQWGAVAGMLAGLVVTLYYLWTRQAVSGGVIDGAASELWFGVPASSAGVFGVPAAFAVMVIVSLLTPAQPHSGQWVDDLRRP